MSNETAENAWVESIFRTENEQFVDTLGMLCTVDIGTIVSIDANNRATVNLSRIVGGDIPQLKDIEVIGLGNNNGAFMADGNNCACLVLAPYSCMPNIRNLKVNLTSNKYDKGGIKALPISNGSSTNVRATFTSEGSLVILTEGYMVCFEKERIACTGTGGFTISLDDKGELYLYRKLETSGETMFKLDSSGIIGSFTNSQNTSIYEYSMSDDGSVVFSHKKPKAQGDPEILNQVQISDDGTLSVTASDKITLSIDVEGNISLTTEGTLSFTAKGDVSIESSEGNVGISSTKGNISLDSKNDIGISSSSGNIDISNSTTGKSVTINGNNLKVDK